MTIDDVIGKILDHEGGIADVGDGKGITRFGQTPQWLKTHCLPKPYSPEEAGINYAVVFERFRIADVIRKDWFTGYVLADMAVHFGEGAAIRCLQEALGVSADGVIGPKTLAALPSDSTHFRIKFLAAKGRRLGRLLESEKIDRREFAAGWTDRHMDQLEMLPV
jgi:lysozyme family protein